MAGRARGCARRPNIAPSRWCRWAAGHHGLNRFVLCLGYKGSMIKNYFLNYEAMTQDWTVADGSRG